MGSSSTTLPAGSGDSGALGVGQFGQLAAGWEGDLVDLGKVVIFWPARRLRREDARRSCLRERGRWRLRL